MFNHIATKYRSYISVLLLAACCIACNSGNGSERYKAKTDSAAAAPAPAAPTARPAPAPAARPAPGTSAPAARPAAQQYGPRQASSDMGAPPAGSPQYSGAQQHATSDLTPTPSFTPPAPTKLDPLTTGSVKGLGQAMGKRPDAGSSPATQKQTTQDLKKSGFDDTKQSSGAAYSGAGLFESLETYLRNKFIKG